MVARSRPVVFNCRTMSTPFVPRNTPPRIDRLLAWLPAVLLAACGSPAPTSATPAGESAAGDPAAQAGLVPPVPVELRSRTLVTQAPEPPPPPPGTFDPDAPPERYPGDEAVPEPRAVRGRSGGASTEGGLEREAVQDIIRDGQARFRHCFDRLRQGRPNVTEAQISVRFSIGSSGGVEEAEVVSAVPDDGDFAGCVRTLVKALDFPASTAPTEVTYPFSFQVTSGD
jgi:hypothetical protein